jgi:hypothetical protein
MSTSIETLERRLVQDLDRLGERLADDRLIGDLYHALAGCTLRPPEGGGHLSLSWGRAAELLNTVRANHGHAAVDGLDQSGGEGEVNQRARAVLEQELGWALAPRDASRADDAHSDRPASPPPADHEPPEWERQAHAEAEEARIRRPA